MTKSIHAKREDLKSILGEQCARYFDTDRMTLAVRALDRINAVDRGRYDSRLDEVIVMVRAESA